MKYSEAVARKLNELLEKNYDAEKGYKNAAEQVKNDKLKAFFREKANERYDFGHQLKDEIRNYGENPDKGSSMAADVHRSWMNLKNFLSGNREEAILEEAVRGEKVAVDEYEKIIDDTNVPPSTKKLLLKHKNSIVDSLNKIQGLEKSFE